MSQRHSYFRFTTSQQRKLLFEIWEETGNVTEACQKAHVGRATFYYWKPRFEANGYAGLEEFESRVAHKLNRKEESIEQSVIAMRRQHPDWGKFRIADELAKGPVPNEKSPHMASGKVEIEIGSDCLSWFFLPTAVE